MEVESADVLRLIQSHLTECGLHRTVRVLQEESGVRNAGRTAQSDVRTWASDGRWGDVLDCLASLDLQRGGNRGGGTTGVGGGGGVPPSLLADVHEMSILELADAGEIDLSYAALRLVSDDIDDAGGAASAEGVGNGGTEGQQQQSRSMSIERRIAALSSLRSLSGGSGGTNSGDASVLIPPDYYGSNNISRQKKRDEIGRKLADTIPIVPTSRLISLLQQAIKWQVHTGMMPLVRECWDDEDDEEDESEEDDEGDVDGAKKRKRKKKKRRKNKNKKFDLVLGEVDAISRHEADGGGVGGPSSGTGKDVDTARRRYEKIPTRPYSTIKFGKKSHVESCLFLPDGSGLVTGSSDGFIEIWDPETKYTQLRTTDLKYQRDDELLMHDTSVLSLSVSNDNTLLGTGSSDGTIKIWKITDGKCLRQFDRAHAGAVFCVTFSNDGSHILSGGHDGTAREFGLRTSRMLKEFRGHGSYVNTCAYVLDRGGGGGGRATTMATGATATLLVITGSADGTVRIWDGKTSEIRHVVRPPTSVSSSSGLEVDGTGMDGDEEGAVIGRNVHTVIPLHVPVNTMIVVPRFPRAYLISYTGAILRTYELDGGVVGSAVAGGKNDGSGGGGGGGSGGRDFVAATVSPTNKWLYLVTEDGVCCCFDVGTGKLEKTINDFGEESTTTTSGKGGGSGGGNRVSEVTGLAHHPHKGIVACYSNEKSQKRGILVLWK